MSAGIRIGESNMDRMGEFKANKLQRLREEMGDTAEFRSAELKDGLLNVEFTFPEVRSAQQMQQIEQSAREAVHPYPIRIEWK